MRWLPFLVVVLVSALGAGAALGQAQGDITLPEPLTQAEPTYPPDALEAGLEADVILKVAIDEQGRVTDAEVVDGAGHGFDEAALEAAKRVRFEPARDAEGNPFAAAIRYRVRFEIDEEQRAPKRGGLRGRVVVADAPIAGATVRLVPAEGEPQEASTDESGAFAFEDLPPGEARVTVEAPGYRGLELTETLEGGKDVEVTYPLSLDVEGAIDVSVKGERPPREVTRRTLERREIQRIPGTKGDALRSIQSLPGVARTPALIGALIVRGSAPFDTQTFVDGVYVPLIYHFGGLSSVVPTELLDRIDFYPGNYSARYGRALGGIVDAGLRSPDTEEYHGFAQLDFIDARLMAEGPVPLLDGWSFAAAGRRSHMDAWLGPVLEDLGAGVTQAPVYYDYQFILEHPDPDRVRLAFYGSDDRLDILVDEPTPGQPALSGNVGLATSFQRLEALYEVKRGDQKLESLTALGHEKIRFGVGPLFADLEGWSLFSRLEHTTSVGDQLSLHAGTDLLASWVNVAQRLPGASRPGEPQNQPFTTRNLQSVEQRIAVVQPAAYLEAAAQPIDRWRLVPGVRVDYTRSIDRFELQPRFNTRFDVVEDFPRTTLKGGAGLYAQPPQPFQSNPPLGTEGLLHERAYHFGLGVEQELTEQIEVSLEGFYKILDDIVVAAPSESGVSSRFANSGTGNSVGAELLARYNPDEHFFGWIAYTLSRTRRRTHPGAELVPVPWDQTHILTVLGSYDFGGGWELGARFRLVSGNLVDPNVCNPAESACDPNRVNALFHAASGAYTPLRFGGDNSERLPLFHQLDIRLDKAFEFDAWTLRTYLDVQNVYNRRNPEGIAYDYRFSTRELVAGLPIIPSLGIRGEF